MKVKGLEDVDYRYRRNQSIGERLRRSTRPWMWWTLGGVIVAPLAVWGLIASVGGDSLEVSSVGKVVTLQKTGVAVSKPALQTLAMNNSMSTLSRLVSAGEVLTPAVGTKVRITYAELFREVTVFQVSILDGRYRGRSGWVTESQIRGSGSKPRTIPLPTQSIEPDPRLLPSPAAPPDQNPPDQNQ